MTTCFAALRIDWAVLQIAAGAIAKIHAINMQ
jgi:hypothetical protein